MSGLHYAPCSSAALTNSSIDATTRQNAEQQLSQAADSDFVSVPRGEKAARALTSNTATNGHVSV